MKEKSLKTIIALITFAVIGLIAIQFYWINLALKLEEEKFNKNVGNALSDLVKSIEDKEAAKVLIREISPLDSNGVIFVNKGSKNKNYSYSTTSNANKNKVMIFGGDTNNVNIEINATNDSNLSKMKISKNITSTGDSAIQETIIWQSDLDTLIHKRTKIIENVFEELIISEQEVSILNRINSAKVDSLLNDELEKYGIKNSFGFAIINKDSLIFAKNTEDKKELFDSKYRIKLFPNDFTKKQNFLVVEFKNREAFLFKSIWWILLSSVFLTALIIVLFYKTIQMLIKQKKITEIKNDLLNNITHEFKTPIATISLAADVIDEDPKIDSKKYTSIIKTESKRLTDMVENILSAAELQSGELHLSKTNENVHNLIKEVADKFELTLTNKKGKFIFDLAAIDPMLAVDKTQLANALSNLIDNAIKYNVSYPIIKISTLNNNKGFEIVIEDNGIGIEKKNYEKVFETFYRVETGNIHNAKGNGVGLSIVKKIIEAHCGTINVSSEKNVGTKFTLNIPRV